MSNYVCLTTGYEKHSPRVGDLFVANAHVRRMRIVTDARVHEITAGRTERVAELGLGDRTRTVRFVVEEVWPGVRWQDLSISEIRFFGH